MKRNILIKTCNVLCSLQWSWKYIVVCKLNAFPENGKYCILLRSLNIYLHANWTLIHWKKLNRTSDERHPLDNYWTLHTNRAFKELQIEAHTYTWRNWRSLKRVLTTPRPISSCYLPGTMWLNSSHSLESRTVGTGIQSSKAISNKYVNINHQVG